MIAVGRMPGADAGLGLGRPWFARVARTALAARGVDADASGDGPVLDIRLVNDAAMAGLNERHLGCVGPTNVLGFEAEVGEPGLGQIALCLDAAQREARLYGQDVPTHCARLLTHAVLHLAGLDHGAAMEAETERILAVLAEDGVIPQSG